MERPIVEERFEYKGFPCVVLFLPWGYRCGYVGIPFGNKYYHVDYMNIPVDCHGGLTYSESELALQDDKETWWIGFDCAHCFDGYDLKKLDEYYPDRKKDLIDTEYRKSITNEYGYRTFDYVKKCCIGIVDQLMGEESEE